MTNPSLVYNQTWLGSTHNRSINQHDVYIRTEETRAQTRYQLFEKQDRAGGETREKTATIRRASSTSAKVIH